MMELFGSLIAWAAGLGIGAVAIGVILRLLGFSWVLAPALELLAALLKPVAAFVGWLVVAAVTAFFRAVYISLKNWKVFWSVYPVVFLAGGWYFGYLDVFGTVSKEIEIRQVFKENNEFRRQLGKPPRKRQSRSRRVYKTAYKRTRTVQKSPGELQRCSLGGC